MWDEFESDIPDSSDLDGTESSDYGDTSDGFGETIDDAPISFGEMGDTSFDTETPLEEDDLGSTDSSLDSDDTDTGFASIGTDQTGEVSDSLDAPFDEDGIEDIDSIPDSSSIDENAEPFEEDEASDAQEGEDFMMEGPVLRRDPDEIADIQERTWLQRADILRDDLRDKGWEDGPQMEEYVAGQMDQWRTEADQTNQTYFGNPDTTPQDEQLEEDVIPDAVSEDDDSSETIEGTPSTASQFSDTDGPEPFEEDEIPDTTTSDSEGEILDQISSDSTASQSIDDMQPLADDQAGGDESEYKRPLSHIHIKCVPVPTAFSDVVDFFVKST